MRSGKEEKGIFSEKRPDHLNVLVLRDKQGAKTTLQSLRQRGLNPRSFPLVSYCPNCDPETLKRVIEHNKPGGLFLSSQRACDFFLQLWERIEDLPEWDPDCFVVGDKALEILQRRDFRVVRKFGQFREMLSLDKELHSQKLILYPCSSEVNHGEISQAGKLGWLFQTLEIYKVEFDTTNQELETLLRPEVSVLVYSSSQARALSMYSSRNVKVFCLGERTAQTLHSLGFTQIYVSKTPEETALLDLLEENLLNRKSKGSSL